MAQPKSMLLSIRLTCELRIRSSRGSFMTFARLVPTFRSSRSVSAPPFCELRKAMVTNNLMILVPLIDLKSLGRTCGLWCRDFRSAVLATMPLAAMTLAALMCWLVPASAQQAAPPPVSAQPAQQQAAPPAELPPPQRQPDPNHYAPDELVGAGHKFFGNVSRGLASVI